MARNEDEIDGFILACVCVFVLCLFFFISHMINTPTSVGPGLSIGEVVHKEAGTTHSELGIRIEVHDD